MRRVLVLIGVAVPLLGGSTGCGRFVRAASDWVQDGDREHGITYYVGGAGPIGNIGSLSVPEGMQDAGYAGYIQVYPWQSVTAAIDQWALERNRSKGAELADEMRRQKRLHPGVRMNIIALSAGTAIATFALERLPEDVKVENAVFLASSLSSHYDLTRSLRRVKGGLYAFYSADDPILSTLVPYTGTVDRRDAEEGVAGLQGFRKPRRRSAETDEQYMKIHNVRCRPEFARYGYEGGHTDGTSRAFIAHVVAPLVLRSADLDRDESRPALSAGAAGE